MNVFLFELQIYIQIHFRMHKLQPEFQMNFEMIDITKKKGSMAA